MMRDSGYVQILTLVTFTFLGVCWVGVVIYGLASPVYDFLKRIVEKSRES
ncbi:MAG: hypothetical protein PHR03_07455 [Desulfovibrionales bacterium]|nr:hypothetical protein [Desulfovibrionales bacterium]